MNKELEAFKNLLKQLFPNYDVDVSFDDICNLNENLNIIRNALKRLEELEKEHNKLLLDYQELVHCGLKSEQKKIKALEIIVDKLVDIRTFISSAILSKHETPDAYNFIVSDVRRYLTQEEFDLLKEIL